MAKKKDIKVAVQIEGDAAIIEAFLAAGIEAANGRIAHPLPPHMLAKWKVEDPKRVIRDKKGLFVLLGKGEARG